MGYRPELDGIRAVAILAVVAYHLEVPLSGGGWMGVDVFFVLSGFLITTLLLQELDQTGRIGLGRFYARRALRLYPALLAMLVVGLPFYRDLGDHGSLPGYGATALAAATYTEDLVWGLSGSPHGNLLHTWSLSVEEQFYLLWPLALLVVLPRRRGRWWIAGCGLASWVFMAATVRVQSADGTPNLAYVLPVSVIWTLLVGCGLALATRRGALPRLLARPAVGASAVGLAGLTVLAGDHFGREPHMVWEATLVVVATAGLLAHLGTSTGAGGPLQRILCWRPLVHLGQRSYGLYLWHFPVVILVVHHLHTPMRALCALAVSILVAELSYRLVERPFLRLRSRFSRPAPAVATTPAPATPGGAGPLPAVLLRPRQSPSAPQ